MEGCILKRNNFESIFLWCDPFTRVALASTCKTLHKHLAHRSEIWDWKVLSHADCLVKAIRKRNPVVIDVYFTKRHSVLEQYMYDIMDACASAGRMDLTKLIALPLYAKLAFYAAKEKQTSFLSFLETESNCEHRELWACLLVGVVLSGDVAWQTVCIERYLPLLTPMFRKLVARGWIAHNRRDCVVAYLGESIFENDPSLAFAYQMSNRDESPANRIRGINLNSSDSLVYDMMAEAIHWNDLKFFEFLIILTHHHHKDTQSEYYGYVCREIIYTGHRLPFIHNVCKEFPHFVNKVLQIACLIGKFKVVKFLKDNFARHIHNWSEAVNTCKFENHIYLRQFCEMQIKN